MSKRTHTDEKPGPSREKRKFAKCYPEIDMDLFSLPKELVIDPKDLHKKNYFTSKTEKHKDTKPDRKSVSKKNYYLQLRKERESFRKRLVEVILENENEDSRSCTEAGNKDFLRYHYYIKYGLDTKHVSPINLEWIERIINLIPIHLKTNVDTLMNMFREMEVNYMYTVKKSIVDFVLQDAADRMLPGDYAKRKLQIEDVSPSQLRLNFYDAGNKLLKRLHAVNPVMVQILSLWNDHFSNLRMIDIKSLVGRKSMFELKPFGILVQEQIKITRQILNTEWLPAVQEIFLKGAKKGLLPNPKNAKAMVHFYNSVDAIMTFNLQSLCLESIADYTKFIFDIRGTNPGFSIKLIHKNKLLLFDPPFPSFEELILQAYDIMIESILDVPRLEHTLYMDLDDDVQYLSVIHIFPS